jgi:Tfp pilus assembly protein FimT
MHYLRQKGFTLVEIGIIIVLLGIIGIIVGTQFSEKSVNVTQQSKRLAADLRYMQNLAMTRNVRTRVNFSSSQYTLTELDGTTPIVHPGGPSNVVSMPSGVVLSTANLANNYIVFDGKGRPYTDNTDPGALLATTATITFTSGGNTATVTIAPETGRVRAQ